MYSKITVEERTEEFNASNLWFAGAKIYAKDAKDAKEEKRDPPVRSVRSVFSVFSVFSVRSVRSVFSVRPLRSLRILCVLCVNLFIFLTALCFTACPTEPDDSWTGPVLKVTIRLNSGDEGAVYYSLATGEQADPHSSAWDLGFYSIDNTPSIFTNSGDTAALLQSGGDGGVWYSDKSLEDAGPDDRKAGGEYAAYVTDVYRWGKTMGVAALQRMNIMTYLGFPSGSGTEADPFLPHDMIDMASYQGYDFNKKQFYSWYSMPPKYSPTEQIYIIKRGDGGGYSKIRVSDIYLEGPYTHYVFEVQYENF
jgi:hypothetical protein